MNRKMIKGAFLITMASLIAKVIGSFFRIPLQNIAGDQVFGIYTLVYPVYMAALILSGAGIPLAISKLISEERNSGKYSSILEIFNTARLLGILFGITGFSLIFSFSHGIAKLLGGQHIRLPLIMVSGTLLLTPFMAVYRGYFQGYEYMRPTAISQILEQIVRVSFILLIAYFLVHEGSTPTIISTGVMAGSLIGAVLSTIYLCIKYQRTNIKQMGSHQNHIGKFFYWSKRILTLSIPICIGSMTIVLVYFIDSITVPTFLSNKGYVDHAIAELYGLYGRGLALVQVVIVFAQSIVLSIIPALTSLLVTNNKLAMRELIDACLYLTHLTVWPITIGLVVLTNPITYSLFGDTRETVLISLTLLSSLFTAFAVLTTGILQGLNRPIQSAYIIIGCSVLKAVLNFILIEKFEMLGVAISTFIVFMIITLLNIKLIMSEISINIWKRSYTVMALSSLTASLMIFIPTQLLELEEWARLDVFVYTIIMGSIGLAFYGVFIFSFRGITRKELANIPFVRKYSQTTLVKLGKQRFFK